MIDRFAFLKSSLALVAAAASPLPIASGKPNPWDHWDRTPLPSGRPLELTMELLDAGKDHFKLSDYRGKALIVNIFATWCGPCNAEQPKLVEAATIYAPAGLAIVGMDCEDGDDLVRAYRKKYGITYPIAMDRRGGFTRGIETGEIGGTNRFPVSVFFAPAGNLYGVKVGSFERGELQYRIGKFLDAVNPEIAIPSPQPS